MTNFLFISRSFSSNYSCFFLVYSYTPTFRTTNCTAKSDRKLLGYPMSHLIKHEKKPTYQGRGDRASWVKAPMASLQNTKKASAILPFYIHLYLSSSTESYTSNVIYDIFARVALMRQHPTMPRAHLYAGKVLSAETCPR